MLGISCPLCGFQRTMLLLFNGHLLESIFQFPIWPIMAIWVMNLVVMSILRKSHYIQHNGWIWIILLASLAFNTVWQNMVF
ncbi:MAG: DUF2752 domain-containing protein [Paludibacteraceae bacterium]|nr:DUF2752 domain-containing protein [Paludibacteraceae bacterium]